MTTGAPTPDERRSETSSIELTAADGHKLAAWKAAPQGTFKGAIVVVQEIFGVNSHIRGVADGFAADGYLAIAPAFFDRLERGYETGYSPDDIAAGRERIGRRTGTTTLPDLAAGIDAASEALGGNGKVGVVGYCWGGYLRWLAAARLPGLAARRLLLRRRHRRLRRRDAAAVPVLLHFGEQRHASRPTPARSRPSLSARPRCMSTRRRPRLQLRPARFVRRRVGEARPDADGGVLRQAPSGLMASGGGPGETGGALAVVARDRLPVTGCR